MKLTKISGKDSQKKPVPVVNSEPAAPKTITETKKVEVNEADEHTGPIPGMTPDEPDYEVMRKRLSRIKKSNPALYRRMINWD